jgi:myo-inositol 2-dehydrogenase/D-chiro-inositol 1-dehydrogenase
MDRRKFLKSASAGACGLLIVKPGTAFGYAANSAVRYALLGCGNRGTSVATSFAKNTGARIVALGDIFPDQLALGKQHFDQVNASLSQPAIDPKLMFHGWDAYLKLAASKEIDAVQISTPPIFHVEHMDGLTAGGKHVYCEKPVGVDVPQTRHALEIAKKYDGKLSLAVGFQIRSAPPFIELVKRIQGGQIGKIAALTGHYDSAPKTYPDRTGMSANEARLRNWLWDRTISGDILLEQNIHVIDICNWVMGTHPESAYARKSHKVITFGDISDNYEVVFTYPGGAEFTFTSTQFNQKGFSSVAERFYGSDGVADSPYGGPLGYTGKQSWTWSGNPVVNGAPSPNNLIEADAMKDRSFIDSITSGKLQNQISAGVDTARTCMMGRKSAELGRRVTWEEVEKDQESYRLGFDIKQFS